MVPSFVDLLGVGLSAPRLATYRLRPDESRATVAGRYLWNAALAEALLPGLHFLEVGIRNQLDRAITDIAGTGWLEDSNVVIDERSRQHVAEVRKRIEDDGAVASHDRLVAGIDFGFWSALFKRQYEVGPTRPPEQVCLWPQIARVVIPSGPARLRVRWALDDRVGGIRILRNRVGHHEPIWNGRPNRRGARVPLSLDYQNMVQLIRGMSPHLGDALRLVDRFEDVLDRGLDPWAAAVNEFCSDHGYAA